MFVVVIRRPAGGQESPSEELIRGNESLSAQLLQVTTEFAQFKRELEKMAFAVGHQLRSARIGQVDFVPVLTGDRSGAISDRVRQEVEWMIRSSSRMLRTFDEFACLYELRSRPLELETVELSALAREVLDGYAQLDPKRGVRIDIEPHLSVVGDVRLLRMLLRSLLGHAWRGSKEDPAPRVAFGSATGEGGGIERCFYVQGSGCGPKRSDVLRLLNAEDLNGTLESSGESRVAMMMVQRIVERHQGRVSFEVVPERGTTIRFTIGELRSNHGSAGTVVKT